MVKAGTTALDAQNLENVTQICWHCVGSHSLSDLIEALDTGRTAGTSIQTPVEIVKEQTDPRR